MKKTNISKFIAVGLCICALTGCGASPDENQIRLILLSILIRMKKMQMVLQKIKETTY